MSEASFSDFLVKEFEIKEFDTPLCFCYCFFMQNNGEDMLYYKECYAIRGAIFAVYNELSSGFTEDVYHEALERELSTRGIPFESQKRVTIQYKGDTLEKNYIPDLVCYGKIIVELKAAKAISPAHQAQLIGYLKATRFRLGLLVNFGTFPHVDLFTARNDNGIVYEV